MHSVKAKSILTAYHNMLDRHFPGLRERYHREYGDAYWCLSPQNAELMRLFHEQCEAVGILHDSDAVFSYIQDFPEKNPQLELF